MGLFADLKGTLETFFRIGLTGPGLKNVGGNLVVRNTGDSADAAVTASQVNVSGNSVVLNSDAAGSGADWSITLSRPTSGMTASYTLTLPVDDGTASQVLSTDGSGNLSWVAAGTTAQCLTVDTTSLAFGSSSTVSMFTLPANAVVNFVRVIIDTAFDGSPTLTVGISGTTSKYMGSNQNSLTGTAGDIYQSNPGQTPVGTTEAIIATYSAGSATAGAARIEVGYYVPA